MRAASMVLFTARGCGEKTMALRVFSATSDLKMAVAPGFVVGTTGGAGSGGASACERRSMVLAGPARPLRLSRSCAPRRDNACVGRSDGCVRTAADDADGLRHLLDARLDVILNNAARAEVLVLGKHAKPAREQLLSHRELH